MKPIVAVLCPMPMEFSAVEKAFGKLGEPLESVFEEKKFDFAGLDVVLARCGVGKTLAAAKTQKLIQMFEPDHLFVCGVAGAIAERLAFIAAKNWAEADCIRDELLVQGIQLKDGKDPATGERITTWEVKR